MKDQPFFFNIIINVTKIHNQHNMVYRYEGPASIFFNIIILSEKYHVS